jgi:uncharacterized protein YkwD
MRFGPLGRFWAGLAILAMVGCTPIGEIVGGSVTTGGQTDGTDQTSQCAVPTDEEGIEQEVLRLVNEIRLTEGLSQLTWSSLLSEIGEEYACTMIESDFFAHVDPDTQEGPGERAIKGGYVFLALGENLAGGQQTPQAVVDAWMNSESHRDNILNPIWQEMGVGVRRGGDYGIYWVQEFGNPP